MRLELIEPGDPRVEPLWRGLEARADASYFLSWSWIENWLACLPRALRPQLAVLFDAGEPAAAAFVASRRVLRHHLLPTRAVFLNATGVARYDELCIEHNGLVRARAVPLATLVDALPHGWHEIVRPGVDASELASLPSVRIEREVGSPFVDLARVRAAPGGYLALLSAGVRAQIRRARRGLGELAFERARDLGEAEDIYGELVALHQASWIAREEPGAFADPWFDGFHRRLIARRFDSGELELVRVRAGGRTVGCLYNLVHRGRVLFYQSGLARDRDPRIKPGLVCHAAAIADAAARGLAVYDFLGGDARYKRELATGSTRLVWARVQRPLVRFAVEDRLRAWKHALV